MEKYKKILTVIDPATDDQKALKRSIELARHTHGEITAFLTIYDFSYEMTTMLSGEEREAMRQSMINDRMQWLEEKIAEGNPVEENPVEERTVQLITLNGLIFVDSMGPKFSWD